MKKKELNIQDDLKALFDATENSAVSQETIFNKQFEVIEKWYLFLLFVDPVLCSEIICDNLTLSLSFPEYKLNKDYLLTYVGYLKPLIYNENLKAESEKRVFETLKKRLNPKELGLSLWSELITTFERMEDNHFSRVFVEKIENFNTSLIKEYKIEKYSLEFGVLQKAQFVMYMLFDSDLYSRVKTIFSNFEDIGKNKSIELPEIVYYESALFAYNAGLLHPELAEKTFEKAYSYLRSIVLDYINNDRVFYDYINQRVPRDVEYNSIIQEMFLRHEFKDNNEFLLKAYSKAQTFYGKVGFLEHAAANSDRETRKNVILPEYRKLVDGNFKGIFFDDSPFFNRVFVNFFTDAIKMEEYAKNKFERRNRISKTINNILYYYNNVLNESEEQIEIIMNKLQFKVVGFIGEVLRVLLYLNYSDIALDAILWLDQRLYRRKKNSVIDFEIKYYKAYCYFNNSNDDNVRYESRKLISLIEKKKDNLILEAKTYYEMDGIEENVATKEIENMWGDIHFILGTTYSPESILYPNKRCLISNYQKSIEHYIKAEGPGNYRIEGVEELLEEAMQNKLPRREL